MRILGVSAGTRNGSNDCMCKEALMGAQDKGAEIEFVHLFDLDIKHCTGCGSCVRTMFAQGKKVCTLHDDFAWLLEKMLHADGIVFAVPVFEKGAPGIFHSVMDRFGPSTDRGIVIAATEMAKQTGNPPPDSRWLRDKVISYICIGGSDWTCRVQCDCAMQAMSPMWKVIDNEVFSWSMGILDDEKKVAKARQIGANLANAAKDVENAQYQGDPGVCPHCHSREFFFRVDGLAECCLCGIKGRMIAGEFGHTFEFPEEQLEYAHNMMSGKFVHAMDIQANDAKNSEYRKTDDYKNKVATYRDFIASSRPEQSA